MRIGELSERTGVSPRSLRYYESRGLMAAQRAPSGHRHYTQEHVDRVALIRAFLAAGVPTRTIAELTPCMARPSPAAAERAAGALSRERARLSAALDDVTRARGALDELIRVNEGYLRQGG